MPWPLIITSIIVGVLLFLTIFMFKREYETSFIASVISLIAVALFGYAVSAVLQETYKSDSIITKFSYHKFQDRSVILVGDTILISKNIDVWKTLNDKSVVIIHKSFNSYNYVTNYYITVDGIVF